MAAREDDSSRNGGVEAFLASCAVSGDDAYGAARAVLERLQAPATRAEARRLLDAVRRRLADDPAAGQEERFRAFNLRIHDVVLQEFIECLDPGIPVPVGGGARPIPGCYPLVVDTPEPAKNSAAPWRGSHGPENHSGAGVLAPPKVIRTIALNFEKRTPVKEQPSPARSSASVRKSTTVMPRLVTRSRILVANRGDPVPPPNKIPKSMYPPENSSMSCTASRMTSRRSREEESFVYSWKTGL